MSQVYPSILGEYPNVFMSTIKVSNRMRLTKEHIWYQFLSSMDCKNFDKCPDIECIRLMRIVSRLEFSSPTALAREKVLATIISDYWNYSKQCANRLECAGVLLWLKDMRF